MGNERFFDDIYENDDPRRNREHYKAWASRYDDAVGEQGYAQPARVADALSRLVPDLGASVLDIGCGTGLSGRALRDAGYSHIDGCDYSTEMLGVAAATGVYRELFAVDLNAPPMDVDDGAYDGAVVVGVFGIGHAPAAALDDITRVVRPDGAVVIAINDHFHREGSLVEKIAEGETEGVFRQAFAEHGDHLPGLELEGWVFGLRVR